MWECRRGIDCREVDVPNCVAKILRSVELGWNFVEPGEEKMARLAASFEKVESDLPALRDWEAHQQAAGGH